MLKQLHIFFQNLIGRIYQRGAVEIHNHKSAVKWYELAAEQEYPSAQVNLGKMYERGEGVAQDYDTALKWYKLAAERGYAADLNRMSDWENNSGNALKFWKFMAKLGFTDAKVNIGTMYFIGESVPQNYKSALRWYKFAAEQEDVGAQKKLGEMYNYGLGTEKNNSLAYMWFKFAALQGSKTAEENIIKLAAQMPQTQLKKAQDLAQECVRKKYKGC